VVQTLFDPARLLKRAGSNTYEPLVFQKSWSTSGSKACWVTIICVGLSPKKGILDPAALAFPTRIVIISPWCSNSLGPNRINILDTPAPAFRHGSGSVVILNNCGIKQQVIPRWNLLEESSGQFRHGSGSVVTPQVASRSKSSSRDLSCDK